jgi:hypothetical protein
MSTTLHVTQGETTVSRLRLTEDGVAVPDHTSVTRAILDVEGVLTMDSADDPGHFDLTEPAYLGVVLGTLPLQPGVYWATLTVFSALHPTGIAWRPLLRLRVE